VEDTALTDATHWAAYWDTRSPQQVPEDWYYGDLLRRIVDGRGYTSMVELGGFPGLFAIYARRYLGFTDVALVDTFVDRKHLGRTLDANGLKEGDIDVVVGDVFDVELPRSYDVVLSGGLVEHFRDPARVLERHHDFVADGGTVAVTVPNFLGLNGLVQQWFDRETLATHNLALMRPDVLAAAVAAAGPVAESEGFYYGGFRAWLEPGASLPARAALQAVRAGGLVLDQLMPLHRATARDVVALGRKR
jgi:SAM-dependent methyltransferase